MRRAHAQTNMKECDCTLCESTVGGFSPQHSSLLQGASWQMEHGAFLEVVLLRNGNQSADVHVSQCLSSKCPNPPVQCIYWTRDASFKMMVVVRAIRNPSPMRSQIQASSPRRRVKTSERFEHLPITALGVIGRPPITHNTIARPIHQSRVI